MKLLVHTANRTIHDASNLGAWQVPVGFEVVEVSGDAEAFVWPNGHPCRAKLDGGAIVADPAWDADAGPRAEMEGAKLMKAVIIWVLSRQLGRAPTAAEIQLARDQVLAVYKAL